MEAELLTAEHVVVLVVLVLLLLPVDVDLHVSVLAPSYNILREIVKLRIIFAMVRLKLQLRVAGCGPLTC